MKIVYITRGPFGLMGSNASYMFPSILSKTADVTVLAPMATKKERENIVFSDPNVSVITITNGKVLARAEECANIIEQIDPDIVHVLGHPRCFIYPMLSRRIESRKRKWLIDVRTHIFGLGKIHLKFEKLMNAYLQRYVDHICYTAESSLHTVLYSPNKPVSWVPIGINLQSFSKPKSRPNKTPFKFVFVGSVAKARKLDVLVRNFGNFALNSDVPVEFKIYGSGNSMESLQAIIDDSGFQNHIQIMGLIPMSEVGQVLLENDAGFVHLPKDKFNDAPALKRIEYAAAGVRIVESDTDYHKLNLEDFKTVMVPDETESFSEILQQFVASKYKFSDILHNHEKSKRFDWCNIVENDLMPIYDEFMLAVDPSNEIAQEQD